MKETKAEMLEGIKDQVKSAKIIANNTLRIEYLNGDRAIRLHQTDVIIRKPSGNIILNSGGWRTTTTKDRINTYSNVRIWQEQGIWHTGQGMFFDGMEFKPDGTLKGRPKTANLKKIDKLKKQIKTLCDLITKDNLPTPNNGDCWYCLMKTQEGETLGDASKDNAHLLSHVKERYLHGSLLVNAMKDAGYRDEQIGFHYSLKLADTFKRSLRKYLQKRLITNIAVK